MRYDKLQKFVDFVHKGEPFHLDNVYYTFVPVRDCTYLYYRAPYYTQPFEAPKLDLCGVIKGSTMYFTRNVWLKHEGYTIKLGETVKSYDGYDMKMLGDYIHELNSQMNGEAFDEYLSTLPPVELPQWAKDMCIFKAREVLLGAHTLESFKPKLDCECILDENDALAILSGYDSFQNRAKKKIEFELNHGVMRHKDLERENEELKTIEELLNSPDDISDPWERTLGEAINSACADAKTFTVVFSRGEHTASVKVNAGQLRLSLSEKCLLGQSVFTTSKNEKVIRDIVGDKVSCKDIEAVIYRGREVYRREKE